MNKDTTLHSFPLRVLMTVSLVNRRQLIIHTHIHTKERKRSPDSSELPTRTTLSSFRNTLLTAVPNVSCVGQNSACVALWQALWIRWQMGSKVTNTNLFHSLIMHKNVCFFNAHWGNIISLATHVDVKHREVYSTWRELSLSIPIHLNEIYFPKPVKRKFHPEHNQLNLDLPVKLYWSQPTRSHNQFVRILRGG